MLHLKCQSSLILPCQVFQGRLDRNFPFRRSGALFIRGFLLNATRESVSGHCNNVTLKCFSGNVRYCDSSEQYWEEATRNRLRSRDKSRSDHLPKWGFAHIPVALHLACPGHDNTLRRRASAEVPISGKIQVSLLMVESTPYPYVSLT